eukprot:TRINITY_DN8559_c0_g1_i2.p1 TRINITY_DN8559_c0_g1~~TRINITY_DN8559_c0_g1_i2.p1  ORF type:complete len:281 (-),score=84.06 TRINITY_DN8559_c0_g1_i2:36-878(-)
MDEAKRLEIAKKLKQFSSDKTQEQSAPKQKRPIRFTQKPPKEQEIPSSDSPIKINANSSTSPQKAEANNMSITNTSPLIVGEIPREVIRMYKAAGVLIWGVERDESGKENRFVLLGCEDRHKKDSKKRKRNLSAFHSERSWSHFGGRIEGVDQKDPKKTALREFGEETGRVLSKWEGEIARQIEDDRCHKVWIESGKHLIFMVKMEVDRSVSQLFLDRTIDPELDCDGIEMDWIPMEELLKDDEFEFRGKRENFSYFLQIALTSGIRDWIVDKKYMEWEE